MKSDKTVATVIDSNDRALLRLRNIHIQTENPSAKLMHRAQEITSRRRESLEMNENTFNELMKTPDEIQEENKSALIHRMAPSIIPAYNQPLDSKLAIKYNQV
jgi:C4-dicarboxylate-specific signal transduction histidine kinase